MVLFLTSTLGENYIDADGKTRACVISHENGLLDNLRNFIPENANGVIISSAPDSYAVNDSVRDIMSESFAMSGFCLKELWNCDGRNADKAKEFLKESEFVILAGGHVPTENRFFNKIGLRALIKDYEGTVIGISAGTMNCAGTVYAPPELDGEALAPDYERYLKGLGLTDINVFPHLQYLRTVELDGFDMVRDIALPDSRIRPFYGLNDGSYILSQNCENTLYGEAYYFSGGIERKICENERNIRI